MIKVSIIIPVYNTEKYLKECLNSAVNQTLEGIEILIGDDGSTDNSLKIIEEFAKNYPNIKSFSLEHKGVASTRNFLLKKASGEYIAFLDSDDQIEEKTYEKMYELAISKKADIVVCGYNEIHDTFTIKQTGLFKDDLNNKLLMTPSLCNKLFHKKLFTNKEFPNIMVGEDLVLVTNILNETNHIQYLNEYLYCYYKRDNSIMNQRKYRKYWDDIFVAFELIMKTIGKCDEVEFLFIQHILRDSSMKYMYFPEGKKSLALIHEMAKTSFPKFYTNKYYKMQNWRYRLICRMIYYRQYWLIKIIRKVLNSDR